MSIQEDTPSGPPADVGVLGHESFIDTALEFTEKLVGPFEVSEVLYELAERLTALLAITGSGISLANGPRLQAATAVPKQLLALEKYQEDHQEGPCAKAFQTGQLQVVTDIREEQDWPGYRQMAEQIGVRAVVGIPMRVDGHAIGAVNLYSTAAREWSREQVRGAMVMANIATAYLVSAAALAEQTELSGQLQHALDSRIVIEQAKGMLAEAHGITVDEAYQRLRAYARSNNRRMHEVAREVIAGGLQP